MDSSREGGWDIDDKRVLEMMHHETQQRRTGNHKDSYGATKSKEDWKAD